LANRLLLCGGTVVDGAGDATPVESDVLVERDRIIRIAPAIRAPDAHVLDAEGLVVAPGFIDAHSHSDTSAFVDPAAQGRVCDGVTTEINGSCGLSLFPLRDSPDFGETIDAVMGISLPAQAVRIANERRASLKQRGIRADWRDAAGYFARVEAAGSAINRAFLVGHGAIRAAVMGFEARPANAAELERMRRLLKQSLEQGAVGLSSGLCYAPGCFAETAELVALCRSLAAYDRPYCIHMRSEGRKVLESAGEALEICRRSGAPLHVSHVKTRGRENWDKIGELERMLFEAREQGLDVTADRYPYTAAMTDLATIFPDWLMAGGRSCALERLRQPETRVRLRREIEEGRPAGIRWDEIQLARTTADEQELEGLTVAEAAIRMGAAPLEAVFELLLRTKMRITAIFFDMCEENLERVLGWPFTVIGSDSSARSPAGPTAQGKPHPRGFGAFSRFLGKYVRERRLMGLPEAIARVTSRTAGRFGLKERGILREGAYADIVAFDAARIHDAATYAEPFRLSVGVRHLIVNGRIVMKNGEQTRARPGRVLRGG